MAPVNPRASDFNPTPQRNILMSLLSEEITTVSNILYVDQSNNQSPSSPMSDISTSSVEFVLDPPTRGFNLPRTILRPWASNTSAPPTEVDPNEEQQSTGNGPPSSQNNLRQGRLWLNPGEKIVFGSIDQPINSSSLHSDNRHREAVSTSDSEESATERNSSSEATVEPEFQPSPSGRLSILTIPPVDHGAYNSATVPARLSKLMLTEGKEKDEHVVMLGQYADDEGCKEPLRADSATGLLTPTPFEFEIENQDDITEVNAAIEKPEHQKNSYNTTSDNLNNDPAIAPEEQYVWQTLLSLQQVNPESDATTATISSNSGIQHAVEAKNVDGAACSKSVSIYVTPSGSCMEQNSKAENFARNDTGRAAGAATQPWRNNKDYIPPHRRYAPAAPLAAGIKLNEGNKSAPKLEEHKASTMASKDGKANAISGTNSADLTDKKKSQWSPKKKKKNHRTGTSTASTMSEEQNSENLSNSSRLTYSFARSKAGNHIANVTPSGPHDPVYNAQKELLNLEGHSNGETSFYGNSSAEDVWTTPLFSQEVKDAAEDPKNLGKAVKFPQYGLIGGLIEHVSDNEDSHPRASYDGYLRPDPRLFLNVNAPWSAFICGSQGSGKSHTLSCILENSLMKRAELGSLPKPLAGILFHYDSFTSHSAAQPCEVAHLCSSGIPVKVLVSPSNLTLMRDVYAKLPMPKESLKPQVEPFLLKGKHLNCPRMLTLMGVNDGSGFTPLYMEVVRKVLRKMAEEGEGGTRFSYKAFKDRLKKEKFSQGQQDPLNLRLEVLESFLESDRGPPNKTDIWEFKPGTLTIVDLSCPFLDETSACTMFDIGLALFLEGDPNAKVGRIIALDEAHKFMNDSIGANKFTDSLIEVIRLQRHLAARVVIATQEPTISPKLLDLCSITFVHRFTSPEWLRTLSSHLAGASSVAGKSNSNEHTRNIFQRIVRLDAGQALVFAPSAMISVKGNVEDRQIENVCIEKLGLDYLKIRVRKRLTSDGGRSIMAT